MITIKFKQITKKFKSEKMTDAPERQLVHVFERRKK